ncbi:MAG: hypothetical protein FWD73_16725 [Polyangiaceae bacterium]|nr:hypothetical protein [Polyangiaceae bacterium]
MGLRRHDVGHLRQSLRSLLRGLVLSIALIVSAPLVFGPAGNAVLRMFVDMDEHHCACGMKPGACGCPDCALLEKARLAERDVLRAHPILKSTCKDDSLIPGAREPIVATAPLFVTLPPVIFEAVSFDRLSEVDPSIGRARPPVPPPRISA